MKDVRIIPNLSVLPIVLVLTLLPSVGSFDRQSLPKAWQLQQTSQNFAGFPPQPPLPQHSEPRVTVQPAGPLLTIHSIHPGWPFRQNMPITINAANCAGV